MHPAFHQDHKKPPEKGPDVAADYWSAIDPAIAQVVKLMDEAETWTIDTEAQIKEAFDQLIARMAHSPALRQYSLDHPEKVVELLAWMRTSSAMMLLHYSSDERREILDRFTNVCTTILQNNASNETIQRAASVAIERFLAFERLAVLRRLFSPERAHAIEKAVASANQLIHADTTTGDDQQ